jgi:hypothetical protein
VANQALSRERGSATMRDSGSVLHAALAVVKRTLKERGFSAKGTRFYRRAESGNTVLLAVQKSKKSSSAESQVTLNYGVYSARIRESTSRRPCVGAGRFTGTLAQATR